MKRRTRINYTSEVPRNVILEKARIGMTQGETFGSEGEGFERVNFGCPKETLNEGPERMKMVFLDP
ncbi:hypothetical protein OA42_05860 [Klebsiella michiganensis]|nr:hypothetical protein OA42_05860 [Klebsiella michiganensis]